MVTRARRENGPILSSDGGAAGMAAVYLSLPLGETSEWTSCDRTVNSGDCTMRPYRRSLITLTLVACALAGLTCGVAGRVVAAPAGQVPLPRKGDPSSRKDESYPGVVVRYDAIRDSKDQRLRLIITYPKTGPARFPTIFVVGWLS